MTIKLTIAIGTCHVSTNINERTQKGFSGLHMIQLQSNHKHKSFDDTLKYIKVDRIFLDSMSLGNKPQPHTML